MIYIIIIIALITIIYFCSIGWISYGFNRIRSGSNNWKEESSEAKISIIIAVRNEEHNILNCLKSFQKIDYNIENFEIIIVNDHSIDSTKLVVDNFIFDSKLDIKLIDLSDKTSKKEALKYGIEEAKYEIIATTDADCVVPKKWVKNISVKFSDQTDMLIGPIVFKNAKGFLFAFQQLDMFAMQGLSFGILNLKKPILNNAANLAYSKKSFNDVNGFDSFSTPSGDDVFLLEKFKFKRKTIKGLLKTDFIVETNSETTLFGFINQRLRWSSKSKYYTDKLLLFFSVIVLIQNITLLFIYFGMLLVENYKIILIILLLSKWLIDFILLFLVASFFKRKRALIYFIPIQAIYPIYIVGIWIFSMSKKFEWKGRTF
ncbi:MAG: glycosyltransferase [Flavobacteriales bacterium]|nr:glycosyltransferase [Flavobacteriales bacterium]